MNEKNSTIAIPFLEGDVIDLYPTSVDHVNLYVKWRNDPDVRKYSRNAIPWNLEQEQKAFEPEENRVKKEILFEIWHKQDKKIIGLVGFTSINWLNRNANIFISIGEPEYWGKDIGPETTKLLIKYGFEELNLHKIYTSVYSPNKRSLKVAQKCGLNYEATLKEQIYIDGEFVDEIKLAIFKEEWFDSKKKDKFNKL